MDCQRVMFYEIVKFGKSTKCATQICESRNCRKIRLELRLSSDANRGRVSFVLYISNLQGLPKATDCFFSEKVDNYWTKTAKKKEIRRTLTSLGTLILYTMYKTSVQR